MDLNFLKTKIPKTSIFISFCFLTMFAWWISIFIRGLVDSQENYYFGFALGVFTIILGIIGFLKSKAWGSFESYIGKVVIFLSLGFMFWGIGSIIIAYYNIFLSQAYPYPSIADLFYIISWPLWLVAISYLSKAIGIKLQFKTFKNKLISFLVFIVTILISYYLLFPLARGGFYIQTDDLLRLFFDFAYPLGDMLIITSSILLFVSSINYLGGLFKYPILFIIFGFFLNYTSDILFSYFNTVGIYHVGGWIDMLYLITFFSLGLGVGLFDKEILNHNT